MEFNFSFLNSFVILLRFDSSEMKPFQQIPEKSQKRIKDFIKGIQKQTEIFQEIPNEFKNHSEKSIETNRN